MKIFSTTSQSDRWHYINSKNVHTYLSDFPYQQDKKLFAVCPYCHNPLRILSRASKTQEMTYYAIHSKKPVNGFRLFDKKCLEFCMLSNPPKLMIYDALSKPAFDPAKLNIDSLRKDLTFYTGFFLTNIFTNQLIQNNKKALRFRDANIYNFPFVLLLAAKDFDLKHRKVANPRISNAIRENSKYFYLNSENQVSSKTQFDNAKIKIQFKNQAIGSGNFLYCDAVISESNDNSINEIFSFHIFAKMFTNLLERTN